MRGAAHVRSRSTDALARAHAALPRRRRDHPRVRSVRDAEPL